MKRVFRFLIGVALILCMVLSVPVTTKADSKENYANLVVFVEFSDTTHDHIESAWGKCFLEDPNIDQLFDGDYNTGKRSLKNYVASISYNKIVVDNIFPQLNEEGKIVPYKLNGTAIECYNNMEGMVEEVLKKLEQDPALPNNVTIDYDGDGIIDNLMIVVPCESGNSNEKFFGLGATYPSSNSVNGKHSVKYNIITESGAYMSLGQSGLIIHEFLHNAFDFPDLYRENGKADVDPVGKWDIMAHESMWVQYPLAYMRKKYINNFEIPTVTENKTGYQLYSALKAMPYDGSTVTDDIKNNQAVILKTDYSDTEFFVVEYRKQSDAPLVEVSPGKYERDDSGYDRKIPGSSLVIYRINLDTEIFSNHTSNPYAIYVFRNGDTYENGIEGGGGDILTNCISQESGNDSFGSLDTDKGLEDGAITYSDGTNSGILISNVGSTQGDQISFDITFAERADENYWKIKTSYKETENISGSDVFMDDAGKMYCLLGRQGAYDSFANKWAVYEEENGTWVKKTTDISGMNAQLAVVNGKYVATYTDLNSWKLCVAEYTGSVWKNVFTSSKYTSSFSIASTADSMYISEDDGNGIYAYQYTGGKVTNLGTVTTKSYPVNPVVQVSNDQVFVMVREFNNNGALQVFKYQSGSWQSLGALIKGTEASIINTGSMVIKGNKIYALACDGKGKAVLYSMDTAGGAGWTQVGSEPVVSEATVETSICFNGDTPIVIYKVADTSSLITQAKILNGDNWEELGLRVFGSGANNIEGFVVDNTCLAAGSSGGEFCVKYIGLEPDTTPTPEEGLPFKDVKKGSWYYDAVSYVCKNGVMSGYADGVTFGPNDRITRAQFATLLWKASGQPNVAFLNKYPDVKANKFYSIPVSWASNLGIITGYGTGYFGPEDNVTREQIAVLLYRYAEKYQKADVSERADLSGFKDASRVSKFAVDGMQWCVKKKIISGKKDGNLDPRGFATRAECAAMMQRFLKG